ncbi:MAG: hypothetical protein IT357_07120 [Gemmatimonadaceae bacterium]|nr:hypothetical protein [Gemmatimonadaceae bacterium]
MSAAVNVLRARPGVVALGTDLSNAISVRVQMPELWQTIAMTLAEGTSVLAMKKAALEAFGEYQHPSDEFVVKLHGWEVLDETVPVTEAGAKDGSTFLVSYRHRRPVR